MKKILYGVSGIGNGHANRQLPLILELAKENKIWILCYDESYATFERNLKNEANIRLVMIAVPFIVGTPRGLDFGLSATNEANKEIDFLKIDLIALDTISKELGIPDLVISDYEPVCAAYAYAKNVPLVTIDQQSKFLYSELPREIEGFTFEDEIQRLHMFFPKAEARISCSFFRTKKRVGGDEVLFFPAPIKPEITGMVRKPEKKSRILVYISSARDFVQSPKEIIQILSKEESATFDIFVKITDLELYQTDVPNIRIWPHGTEEFLKALKVCDGVVTTAGHSLLSEAMYLSIPVYAIPVAPYEQHLNAKIIGDNGFGVSETKLLPESLNKFIANLEIYGKNIKEDKSILVRGIGQDLIVDYLKKRFLGNKKILLFSPPFAGHLNVLKELMKDLQDKHQFHLVITGWDNIKPDLTGIDDLSFTILTAGELKETDPALWTFPRANRLMDEVLRLVEDFKPDLIIYDFFSIEGNLAGRIKNIPYWCSVPALMGPNDKQEYLADKLEDKNNVSALNEIRTKFGVEFKIDEVEMISDGLHLPGQINIVWSFLEITPKDFRFNRADRPYVFCGNLRGDNYEKRSYKNYKPLIYLSFGTVVMDNLWNRQSKMRDLLKKFIYGLAEKWKNKNYQIIFTTQGKQVLESYPDNWWVYDKVDQVEILSRADLFITHGGSNSFHESICQKVPMIVIPFFGDQLLVAKMAEEIEIGRQVGGSNSIDTHAEKSFLSDLLVEQLEIEVEKILSSSVYVSKYMDLDLSFLPIKNLLAAELPLKDGDLVIGESEKIVRQIDDLPLKVEEYLKYLEMADTDVPEKILKVVVPLRIYLKLCKTKEDKWMRTIDFFSRLFRVHCLGNSSEVELVKKFRIDLGPAITFYEKTDSAWIPMSLDKATKQEKIKADKVVFLASENNLKKEALVEALSGLGEEYEIKFLDPKLEFNEQLVGIENILEAVFARLRAVRGMSGPKVTIISIVSGLVKKNHEYQDIAIALVENGLGEMKLVKSRGLVLPLNSVQKAKLRDYQKFTVGSVLGEEEASHELSFDPHKLLSKGMISRKWILTEMIRNLIY